MACALHKPLGSVICVGGWHNDGGYQGSQHTYQYSLSAKTFTKMAVFSALHEQKKCDFPTFREQFGLTETLLANFSAIGTTWSTYPEGKTRPK